MPWLSLPSGSCRRAAGRVRGRARRRAQAPRSPRAQRRHGRPFPPYGTCSGCRRCWRGGGFRSRAIEPWPSQMAAMCSCSAASTPPARPSTACTDSDPARETTRLAGALAAPTHGAAALLLSQRAFAFGGAGPPVYDLVQEYDPASGNTRVVGHLPAQRADLAAAAVGRRVVVAAGFDGIGPLNTVLATTDERHFRLLARLPEAARYPAVAGGRQLRLSVRRPSIRRRIHRHLHPRHSARQPVHRAIGGARTAVDALRARDGDRT